jgi:hypothetical protein
MIACTSATGPGGGGGGRGSGSSARLTKAQQRQTAEYLGMNPAETGSGCGQERVAGRCTLECAMIARADGAFAHTAKVVGLGCGGSDYN